MFVAGYSMRVTIIIDHWIPPHQQLQLFISLGHLIHHVIWIILVVNSKPTRED